MTPAATVSGATPDITKNTTAGTPRRSRASAADTGLTRRGSVVVITTLSILSIGVGGGGTNNDGPANRGDTAGGRGGATVTPGASTPRCPPPPWSRRAGDVTGPAAARPGGRGSAGWRR